MKLGTQVGLGPAHIVLDGDPAPLPKEAPQFSVHVRCGQTAGWSQMKLGTQVGLGPAGHIVLDENPALLAERSTAAPRPSKFTGEGFACVRIIRGPWLLWRNGWTDQDAIWHGGRPSPSHIVLDMDPACPKKGHSLPKERSTPPEF